VRSIAWEALYGNSILDLNSRTPENDSDDDDDDNVMQHICVLNKRSNQLSPMKEAGDMCHPCSPFDKEFMDHHKMNYLKKKGVHSVQLKVLKSQLGKRFKNCQVSEFEGRGMIMSQMCYCKVHCLGICIKQHQDSRTIGLMKTDFSWLCPDTNLSCWQKFHL
jgi:hypothetical protein